MKHYQHLAWVLFAALCIIWGSSFVLMKIGMFDSTGAPVLSAWQVAAIRIVASGLVLLPFVPGAWRRVQPGVRGIVFFSGWLGSFLPALLFCLAEAKIDSALAGSLNATTPLFTIGIAWFFYRQPIGSQKLWGIVVGLSGSLLLLAGKLQSTGWVQVAYGSLVLLATVCYGWNVNVVKEKLSGTGALDIATLAFAGLLPFALLLLTASGYWQLPLTEVTFAKATAAAIVLGAVGTAFASIIFYKLVQLSGIVFASLVTYGIPFVAIGWGMVYGENIGLLQVLALLIILLGVYIANRPVAARAS